MRYTQSQSNEPDYKAIAHEYSRLIGCLMTKLGPTTLTSEDFELYDFAQLRPIQQEMPNGDVKVYLLAEDEWQECARTGKNPRD